jgi:hypothetical protein
MNFPAGKKMEEAAETSSLILVFMFAR